MRKIVTIYNADGTVTARGLLSQREVPEIPLAGTGKKSVAAVFAAHDKRKGRKGWRP